MSLLIISTNEARFNSALARYMALTKALPNDVLEKKGRDLGIRLYQGFRGRQFGGPQKNAGIARRELARRTAMGEGTVVRDSLLAAYAGERIKLAKTRLGLLRSSDPKDRRALRSNLARRANLWRIYVGKEIAARQRGIGVLAASFLWYRKRSSQARGTYFVRNRTGRPLGYVEKGDGYLRIVSEVDGIEKVNQRYGIVDRALGEAAADMMTYIRRKERDNFAAAFASSALAAGKAA